MKQNNINVWVCVCSLQRGVRKSRLVKALIKSRYVTFRLFYKIPHKLLFERKPADHLN